MAAFCKLDNNHQVVRYHAAAKLGERPYLTEAFYYIGDGVVHSVNGIPQLGDTRLSFFKLREDRPWWAK